WRKEYWIAQAVNTMVIAAHRATRLAGICQGACEVAFVSIELPLERAIFCRAVPSNDDTDVSPRDAHKKRVFITTLRSVKTAFRMKFTGAARDRKRGRLGRRPIRSQKIVQSSPVLHLLAAQISSQKEPSSSSSPA